MKAKFQGMSYEQASREGERLIKEAAATGHWHSIVDDLVDLKRLMMIFRGNQ